MRFDRPSPNGPHPCADVIAAIEKMITEAPEGAAKEVASDDNTVHTLGTLLEEVKKKSDFGMIYVRYWRNKNHNGL